MIESFIIFIFAAIMIFMFSNWFASASSNIGDYYRLPRSVKGATLDAISSSFPELMVALFSLLAFSKFEVGIGTIAGSALFNLLIIPAACVMVSPVIFKVDKSVVKRDGMFYIIAVFALLAALMYSDVWGLGTPLVFLLIYAWYLKRIIRDTGHFKRENRKGSSQNISICRELAIMAGTMIAIAIASFFLTENAIIIAETFGIPHIIIGFTIVAAATSFPDTIISVVNARKGDVTDAASNVFGSNIFDILIGLSIPIIIAVFLFGQVGIIFNEIEIIVSLLGATILIFYVMLDDYTLSRRDARIMLILYFVFVLYVISLSFGRFNFSDITLSPSMFA